LVSDQALTHWHKSGVPYVLTRINVFRENRSCLSEYGNFHHSKIRLQICSLIKYLNLNVLINVDKSLSGEKQQGECFNLGFEIIE
jgi:hypothetical protein